MLETNTRIAFIGCGNMGEAILKCLLEKKVTTKDNILVATRTATTREYLKSTYGVQIETTHKAAFKADIVILAIKPQQLDELPDIAFGAGTILVSVLAGTPVDRLRSKFGGNIVRAMPNLGFKEGFGMTGLYFDALNRWHDSQIHLVQRIFECGGSTLTVAQEEKMDAITAISGSGPAYYFRFSEALMAAAHNLGFTKAEGHLLIEQTFVGAAEVYKASGHDMSEMRQSVTSKGGTTEAALKVFNEGKFEQVVQAAVQAAAKRSRELGHS